ncbi:hypothetical protein CHH67_04960 [Paenibacillus campinasensis]|uniref:Uncharacterized protein n=1 Tax=Paenibacillus campinasensis TaxID=66347 RepID=A0A268F1M6_9BACL|nr:hypothetical protein CHH67_04960 [Paenibacillus campinasensis]
MPHWQDLPAIVKYEETSGTITSTRYEWETSSSKTWGFDDIELDGERYRFESLDLGTVGYGSNVTLHYLENSKYIVKITDSYGNEIRHTFSSSTVSCTLYRLMAG